MQGFLFLFLFALKQFFGYTQKKQKDQGQDQF